MSTDAFDVSALDDLILGRGVRRGRHELPIEAWPPFRERLLVLGFWETAVSQIDIQPGVRVPAWLLRPPVADFGTVFWEIFTPRSRRKLFGSQVRNRKGDWEIQLGAASLERVFASPERAETYDVSRPVGLY